MDEKLSEKIPDMHGYVKDVVSMVTTRMLLCTSRPMVIFILSTDSLLWSLGRTFVADLPDHRMEAWVPREPK